MSCTRRDILRLATAAALAAALPGGEPAQAQRQPNILFIFTDQQMAAAMSCTGNRDVHTPNLDALAASGVRFEQAYCTYPLCSPSRASMFTGHLPQHLPVMSNVLPIPDPYKANGMGWVFRHAGYDTGYAGKWHLPRTTMDEGHGFEVLCGMDDELVTRRSIEFLGRSRTRPFLLVASFIEPHGICSVTRFPDPRLKIDRTWADAQAFANDFTARCPTLPENLDSAQPRPQSVHERHALRGEGPKERPAHYAPEEVFNASLAWKDEQLRHYRYAYSRWVEDVDARIGTILASLRTQGLDQNTLVIFSSDHGEMLGAHGLTMKNYFYEESVRIPFLASMPGRIPAGRVVADRLVSNGLDLLPTLCDYAGITPPANLPGRSLRPLLEGQDPHDWRQELVIACGGPTAGRMLHTGRYTYMAYDRGADPEELFDLATDRGQMHNRISDPAYATVLAECRARLAAWRAANNDPAPQR